MSTLCWLRRDLRLHDNQALSKALGNGETQLVFVFDSHILEKLNNPEDKRLTFIMHSLREIEETLRKKGSSLHLLHGKPEEEIPKLAKKLKVTQVYCNRDYEPYAKERDEKVKRALTNFGIGFEQFKDQVIFEKHEVLTGGGGIYKVFTPYKNKWLERFDECDRQLPDYSSKLGSLAQFSNPESLLEVDWFSRIGFTEVPLPLSAGSKAALKRLKRFEEKTDDYDHDRNFPAKDGTSGLSPYLRFGNLSVRDMVRAAHDQKWLSEIVWRDFYQMILDVYPRVVSGPFKPEYSQIKWKGKKEHFELWCEGQTGFPIIDAAMRCLNETGLMHNRLRMITASFLCKTLLLDWRWGEAYFAEKLLDFDLASNNGGWQWSASTGMDAQPYFRIFNPYSQAKKFDPDGEFINRWCPNYKLKPIVSYETNRVLCLEMYSVVKKS